MWSQPMWSSKISVSPGSYYETSQMANRLCGFYSVLDLPLIWHIMLRALQRRIGPWVSLSEKILLELEMACHSIQGWYDDSQVSVRRRSQRLAALGFCEGESS